MPSATRSAFAAVAALILASSAAVPGRGEEPLRTAADRPLDCLHIRLELDVDLDDKVVEGVAHIDVAALREVRSVVLDAKDMDIAAVTVTRSDGETRPAVFDYDGARLSIPLAEALPRGTQLKLTVQYRVEDPRNGLHFFGPSEHEPDVHRVVWSQGETVYNSYWFPCFDHPNDMQTTELVVTADADLQVSGNGRLLSRRPSSDGTRATWHWLQDKPHVAYLVSMIVGDFHVVEDTWNDIPVEYWVHPGYAEQAERSFANTTRMLEFFSERIGVEYPWDRYAQIACEGFGGGMENTSATTLGLRALHDERSKLDADSDGLIAHELAHQWWGDLLTCRDWAHLWLNEGFATYFEALWAEHDRGPDAFAYNMYRKAARAQRGGRERPIVDRHYPHPGSMFDSRSYPKGAWVLHMIRRRLGDETFWRVLQRYASDHAHRSVETVDLRKTIERITGRSFERFFHDWTERPGHPEVQVATAWIEDERLVKIDIRQTQESGPFHFPLHIELLDDADAVLLTRTHAVKDRAHTLYFALPRPPAMVRIDPDQAVLMDLSETKGRQQWQAQLQRDTSVVLRIRAARHLGKSRRPADVTLLAEALAAEPFWGVRSEIARILGDIGGDDARDALIAGLGSAEPRTRRACAEALGSYLGDERAAAALRPLAAAGDPSYYAEAAAISSYIRIGPSDALEVARDVLGRDSRNEVLRTAALRQLHRLDDPAALELLLEWTAPDRPRRCRPTALDGLAWLSRRRPLDDATWARIVDALIAALHDSGARVRRSAASALGRLQDPERAAPALDILQQLAAHDGNRRVRSAAEEAAGSIRRGKPAPLELTELREELEAVLERNKALEARLEKLEQLDAADVDPAETVGAAPGPAGS